jgi:hypothetical protein
MTISQRPISALDFMDVVGVESIAFEILEQTLIWFKCRDAGLCCADLYTMLAYAGHHSFVLTALGAPLCCSAEGCSSGASSSARFGLLV